MTENIFFFPMLPWGRSQAPGGDRYASPSLRGLHTPSHSFPSITFPICWFYALHNLTAQHHRLFSIPHHHGCVQGRGIGKKGPKANGKLVYHKTPPLPLQPRKDSTCPEGRLGASHTGLSHRMSQQKLRAYPSSRGTCSLAPLQHGTQRRKLKANTAASGAQTWG